VSDGFITTRTPLEFARVNLVTLDFCDFRPGAEGGNDTDQWRQKERRQEEHQEGSPLLPGDQSRKDGKRDPPAYDRDDDSPFHVFSLYSARALIVTSLSGVII